MLQEIFELINIFDLINLIFAVTAISIAILSIYFSIKITRKVEDKMSEFENALGKLRKDIENLTTSLERKELKAPSVTQPAVERRAPRPKAVVAPKERRGEFRVRRTYREVSEPVPEVRIESLGDLKRQVASISGVVVFSSDGMVIDSSGSVDGDKIAAYLTMSYEFLVKAGVSPEYVTFGNDGFGIMLKLDRYGDSDIYAYIHSEKILSQRDIDVLKNSIRKYIKRLLRGRA